MSSLPRTSSERLPGPGERLVVGVADYAVSMDARAFLVTHALGSCLAIVAHDPVARVGALLHVMLPDSSIDVAKAAANPSMFVDTGVPHLFREAYKLGALKERMVVKVMGGACVHTGTDMFEIGKRNVIAVRRILWKNNVIIRAQDIGGSVSRTVTLDVGTGTVQLRTAGADTYL